MERECEMLKLVKRLQTFHRSEAGITGLETAIIMIAFVVVASVFAYTVLSAGIFSAEKGKDAIYSALGNARASMALSGSVTASASGSQVNELIFTVAMVLGGEPLNLTTTTDSDGDGVLSDETNPSHELVITYLDKTQRLEDLTWTKSQIGQGDGDDLMEGSEKFTITVKVTGLTNKLGADDRFTLEIKPSKGSTLMIQRTIPPSIDKIMDLK